ncbi:hypothetical protein GGTG_08509 [Gaeumannomyces tritici R3-111a-1]|uniref:Uncharacterized protein n=1 Tax=Gaeumannomyces tritici (strain R3-111a-1) TaxID=644352 RepID=J3P4S3_GAET3|nr:hypothetical protein GGTG_08509 [Gaeumannomyces tritici R3-111a-1]EJT74670.1 hypothetical protein GGTG_08509 [Gaeumannomyces tritici R3-111a-1]
MGRCRGRNGTIATSSSPARGRFPLFLKGGARERRFVRMDGRMDSASCRLVSKARDEEEPKRDEAAADGAQNSSAFGRRPPDAAGN